jgi:hypothetical protein
MHTAGQVKGDGLNLFESTTHSFIIKIWLEETLEEADQAVWRGHITHVPSGRREYVKDLDEILTFIMPYLEKMGVKFGAYWRIKQALNWLKKGSQTHE